MSDIYSVPWSIGCAVPRDVAKAHQAVRRDAYVALKKAHKGAGHEGTIDKCRKCKADILKLDA